MTVITPVSGGVLASAESGSPSSVPISRHELAEVQRDDPVAGRDAVAGLVLEHVDELLLGRRVGVDPELLDARRLEQALDAVGGGLPQNAAATDGASGLRLAGSLCSSPAATSTLS